jgi:hypothetical protein
MLAGFAEEAAMIADEFRLLALATPGAVEGAHQRHPDFRIGGKIFATLGYPDARWAMVKLTPDEQALLIANEPAIFSPANGAWGRSGSTLILLERADQTTVRSALAMARARIAA